MGVPRFYCPVRLVPGTRFTLPDAAANHAARVLRLQEGNSIILFNGEGGEYSANLATIARAAVTATVMSHHEVERESPVEVTLIQALAAGDKMDWVVQKSVELGVTRIQPVTTRRSVLRLDGDRAEKRVAHWQAIAIGACEQSGRNRIPPVLPICHLDDALATGGNTNRIALAPTAEDTLGSIGTITFTQPLSLLIGPEGGFSDEEIGAMRLLQCQFVHLGPRVMRTETAGIAALAAIQILFGDLNR